MRGSRWSHLYKACHPQCFGDFGEILEVLVWQHGGNEQHGVRPLEAGEIDLPRVNYKLLAQEWALAKVAKEGEKKRKGAGGGRKGRKGVKIIVN